MIQCLLSHAQIWVRSITGFWAPKFETTTQRLTYLLTRVKSRDASASKKHNACWLAYTLSDAFSKQIYTVFFAIQLNLGVLPSNIVDFL